MTFANRIFELHNRWATKKVIIVLALIYPIFPAVLLPLVGDVGGAPILDLHLFYNAETARHIFLQYDESALENYRLCALTVDVVYPIYYAFFLSLLLGSLLKTRCETTSPFQFVRLMPFLMMLLDWAENLTLVAIVNDWPVFDPSMANKAGFLTLAKWSVLSIIVVLLIGLALSKRRVAVAAQ